MYSLSFMPDILTALLMQSKKEISTRVGIHAHDYQCSNARMDIFEIRRNRLEKLIHDDFGGNQAAFSRFTHLKPSQVNRWLSKNAETIPSITEVSAREIERKCNKPQGWMDSDNPMPLLSPHALRLAEIVSSLPGAQQAMIINLIESTLEMQRQALAAVRPVSPGDHLDK